MRDSLDRHLDALATRMGGFLRGFDNPRLHLGSAARFAIEFRKITEYPALHASGEGGVISYSKAAGSYRAPHIEKAGEKPADPVFTMIHALGGQSTLSAGIRPEFPLDRLRRDVVRLLRVPLLLFYLQVSDRASFFTALDEVAEKGRFPLARGARGSAMVCPGCGSTLPPGSDRSARRCTSCGQVFESFFPLPMVSGVVAYVSYEMLRQAVALDSVESYQEEGDIQPLVFGSEVR